MRVRHKDVRAIAELSWELLIDHFHKNKEAPFRAPPFPDIKIEKRRRGKYLQLFSLILIPTWVLTRHEAFVIYYVSHELLHAFITGHDHTFKRAEGAILRQWGISIRWAVAYPKSLKVNGQEVYHKTVGIHYREARRPWECNKCTTWIFPPESYFQKGSKRFCIACSEGIL